MKTKRSVIMILVVLQVVFLVSGCASWTTIKESPPFHENFTGVSPSAQREGLPAILVDCRVTSNGVPAAASQDFINRFVNELNRTGLFQNVRTGFPGSVPPKIYTLSLSVAENSDPHQGAAMVKGFFIGLSLFTLTPALPLRVDFESQMHLTVSTWDGRSKHYTARGEGAAKFHLFANAAQAGQDVVGKVTTANINSLMNQMMQDSAFYNP